MDGLVLSLRELQLLQVCLYASFSKPNDLNVFVKDSFNILNSTWPWCHYHNWLGKSSTFYQTCDIVITVWWFDILIIAIQQKAHPISTCSFCIARDFLGIKTFIRKRLIGNNLKQSTQAINIATSTEVQSYNKVKLVCIYQSSWKVTHKGRFSYSWSANKEYSCTTFNVMK